MRIIIADDEPLARKRLGRLLEMIPDCTLVGEAANGEEAILCCSEHHPDILLLDIRMPGIDGLEVAQQLSQLKRPPAIIFTTAFDNHALAAFKTNAVAYLLKPVRKEQLQQAIMQTQKINRAQLAKIEILQEPDREQSHLSVQVGNSTQLILVDEIDFFRAEQKYVSIYRGDDCFLTEEPLRKLEERFSCRFMRIHRNALVAIRAIESLQRDHQGHYQLKLHRHDQPLEVSRRLVNHLKQLLNQ